MREGRNSIRYTDQAERADESLSYLQTVVDDVEARAYLEAWDEAIVEDCERTRDAQHWAAYFAVQAVME